LYTKANNKFQFKIGQDKITQKQLVELRDLFKLNRKQNEIFFINENDFIKKKISSILNSPSEIQAHFCKNPNKQTCDETLQTLMLNEKINSNEAEDSYSIMPLLTNKPNLYDRTNSIHHSIDGKFAIRSGNYKLIFARGSGGWSAPTEAAANKLNLPAIQLYNLHTDPKEQHNIAAENPQIIAQFKALLEKQIVEGRSTPGKRQKNDVSVNF
jgi:hypothetical protein